MVRETKGVGRDESLRMDQLGKKLEVCQVFRVWTHNDPDDMNWMVCDVIIQDSVPLSGGAGVDVNGPAVRLRVPVRQELIGNRDGKPWTPKVGDSVIVGFYQNDRPVIMGAMTVQAQKPVCRSSSNPGALPAGAHEEWLVPDYHNIYDWRMKLCQWLFIPRNFVVDADGEDVDADGNRGWWTTFDRRKQSSIAGKLRPVCLNYFDKTRDFMAVFECKAGKAAPDCEECELNWCESKPGKGPDLITECTECSGDIPAMNAWLKILSSDYTGDMEAAPADLPRRLKYHHSCGSLFCFDSNFPANDRFVECNKHRGRIWLESQETTCGEGAVHNRLGHLHFRGEANIGEEVYPCTAQAYGKFNLSLRSWKEKAAHIELWGDNDWKGRVDIVNQEIGALQENDDHCGISDAHFTIKQTDGVIQIHSLGGDGAIFEIAKNKITIKSCADNVEIISTTKILLDAPEVECTGHLKAASITTGSCEHGACSCPCSGGGASIADVAAAIQSAQEAQAAKTTCTAATSSVCTSGDETVTCSGGACCSGSSGSASMDQALDACCTVDDSMVFSDGSCCTAGEGLSASDLAALDAMVCCWESEPVTYDGDWLGCV